MIAAIFALSSLGAYSIFAMLPQILMDQSGLSQQQAGFALFVWAVTGIPLSIAIPLIATRAESAARLAIVAAVSGAVGFVGLVVWPSEATLVWVALTGVATLIFPLVLTLIPHRTDNHYTATHLGGLVNTFGYLTGALGPIAVGALRAITDSWVPGLVLLAVLSLLIVFAYPVLRRGGSVNEELRTAHARLNE
jgi:CP family cyanate transporter-like MFS transporter